MTILIKNKHTLQVDDFKFRCCIGKKGSTSNKKEGDKKTPKGTFEIENLYFRKDRKKKPLTLLNCIEIKKNMGWCDDVRFPKIYNKLFKIKKKINLDVVGLMCLPPADIDPSVYFKEMNFLNIDYGLSELSMGMSSDYIEASKNSATYLRIGSNIFGKRY